MGKRVAFLSGTALATLLVGSLIFVLRGSTHAAACSATAIAGGAIGGPFTLVTEDGLEVTDVEIITEPSIIYFGYTFCPDVCPIDSARNAAAVDILDEMGNSVTPIFITIDPLRDTVEVVSDYTENFHPKMIGLTGSETQIKSAANEYRIVFSKADDDPDYYLMNHSVFSYFVTPEDGFIEFFRRDDSPEQVAERIACHLS